MAQTSTADTRLACATREYVLLHKEEFGGKTVSLALLQDAGYRVPSFVALSSSIVSRIALDELKNAEIELLAFDADKHINAHAYAVRSSAFAEDGSRESHAGGFSTLLDVAPQGLQEAVVAVIRDACAKGHGTSEHPFSVIIQEYIPADVAGVCFTRNPLGGREAVIEWRNGRGVDVVGGGAVSRVYINDDNRAVENSFLLVRELFTTARKIETFFDAPQDIEWAVAGGALCILQSRPITTIKRDAFLTYRSIDAQFKDKDSYYLSRESLGESFSQTTPLAYDILSSLYTPKGPVGRAYRTLGVSVEVHSNFEFIHGALYVNKERELEQFFPAYGYVATNNGMVPRIVRFRGLWTTVKNTYQLSHLSYPKPAQLRKKIDAHARYIESVSAELSSDAHYARTFLALVYEDIFLTNLFTEHVFRAAEKALLHVPYNFTALLALPLSGDDPRPPLFKDEMKAIMLGNSINIADRGEFVANTTRAKPPEELLLWWNARSKTEKVQIVKWVTLAQEYQSLREDGRHLTVMLVSLLRRALLSSWKGDEETMYFATLDELLGETVDHDELLGRKRTHEKNSLREMPNVIASVKTTSDSQAVGVSSGLANGVVAILPQEFSEETILLTDRLSPDLAPYLARVVGIIATEGGLLSHMAILAREAGVPVVVDSDAKRKIRAGMRVTIDGGSGTIVVDDGVK